MFLLFHLLNQFLQNVFCKDWNWRPMEVVGRARLFYCCAFRCFTPSHPPLLSPAAGNPFFLYMAFSHTHRPQFSSQQFTNSSIRGHFGDSLSELDWEVGQIMTAIREAQIENNTFVFFTSDNGHVMHVTLHFAVWCRLVNTVTPCTCTTFTF